MTQLVREPTFTTSNNIVDLILVSNTEIVGDVTIVPPRPKCHHCPVVLDLSIEVNDVSNSVNVSLWNKGKYTAINEEHERINWESMFESQARD